MLDIRDLGRLGYNAQTLEAYSIVLGWHLTRCATLRARVLAPRTSSWWTAYRTWIARRRPRDANYFGVELGASF